MPRHIFAQPIVVITLQRFLAALDFFRGPENLTYTGKSTPIMVHMLVHI